jgi:hypothetical protein
VEYDSSKIKAHDWKCDTCFLARKKTFEVVDVKEESPSKQQRDLEAQTFYVNNYGLRGNRKNIQ